MIYKSKKWFQNIDMIIDELPCLDELAGMRILITGASGLVLSSLIDVFIRYNETHSTQNIIIFAAGRCMGEMRERFGDFCDKDYFKYVFYDATKMDNQITVEVDYIIHGASNAFPAMIVKEPVETMMSNITGLLYLFNYAKDCLAKRILYISSSEIYGVKDNSQPYKENEYGFIDLLNSRNSYSVGKRAAETLCVCYSDEYGIESVIARPGHIYGPTASPLDNRVSSIFAYQAAKGEDIILKSDGAQLRSYCYCLDCATALIIILLRGKNMSAYNISNPDSVITIRKMAELFSQNGNVCLIQEMASEEEKKSFNPMSNSSLVSDRLLGLGWKGLFNAKEGISNTVTILKESIQ